MDSVFLDLKALSTCTEDSQPIQSFRLFTGLFFCAITELEFYWGLEKGELDLWSPLNRISVRADIGRLILSWELALVPTDEVLRTILYVAKDNRKRDIDQRRNCFEALPPGEYEYSLVPVQKIPPRLFLIKDHTNSFEKLDIIPPHYPRVKLNVHPVFAVVHGAWQLLQDIHEDLPFFDMMSRVTTAYCALIPREFRARRPRTREDQQSAESDDSGNTIEEDDYSSEEEAIRIYSWLESTTTTSVPAVEQVSETIEDDSPIKSRQHPLVKDVL
ncbi:hypothetical protein DFH05DRAFT_1512619 [Lentinula detonsa]|uniref:HNH nuclease domain-containing protein n=1 Tax=Lentinula detonsa TaxID=2804962 RepID=A0A9W8NRX5_9AGAR|nr:hypothetical protein DFH05DRAFT_1512619 [Lentinula detonsa]